MREFLTSGKYLNAQQQRLVEEAYADLPEKSTVFKTKKGERTFLGVRWPVGAKTPETIFSDDGNKYHTPNASSQHKEPVVFFKQPGSDRASESCLYSEWVKWRGNDYTTEEPPITPTNAALKAQIEAIKAAEMKKQADDQKEEELEAARNEGRNERGKKK